MKIYVAGKFTDKENIQKKMEELKKLGCTITHDWTRYKKKSLADGAEKDINGVKNCDMLIAIMDNETYPYRGTFSEIGAGSIMNKKIIIYTPQDQISAMTNCFYWHPCITHIKKWETCINMVKEQIN